MDPTWLVIPAAIGVLLVRTLMIARRLKTAAANPTLTDTRALRAAKRTLRAHRTELGSAIASSKEHLAAAKRLTRLPASRGRPTGSRVERMVEDGFRVDAH